jgi:hypothetical protein
MVRYPSCSSKKIPPILLIVNANSLRNLAIDITLPRVLVESKETLFPKRTTDLACEFAGSEERFVLWRRGREWKEGGTGAYPESLLSPAVTSGVQERGLDGCVGRDSSLDVGMEGATGAVSKVEF